MATVDLLSGVVGLPYGWSSLNNGKMFNAIEDAGMSFTAPVSGTVSQVKNYMIGAKSGYGDGDGGIYTVSIRKVDGTVIGTGTYDPQWADGWNIGSYSTAQKIDDFFPRTTMSMTQDLVAGTKYVVSWHNDHPDPANNFMSVDVGLGYFGDGRSARAPSHAEFGAVYVNPTTGVIQQDWGDIPILEVKMTDGTVFGHVHIDGWQPAHSNTLTTGSKVRQLFSDLTGVTGSTHAGIRVDGSGTIKARLTYTNGTVISESSNVAVSSGWGWYETTLTSSGVALTSCALEWEVISGTVEFQAMQDGSDTYGFTPLPTQTGVGQVNTGGGWSNWYGSGDLTTYFVPVTGGGAPTAPGQVTGLTATPGDTTVSLTFTAPASDGGSAITDYLIEYQTSPSGGWSTFVDGVSAATSAVVTGLVNGTVYDFRVSAVNAEGTGAVSATATTTPGEVPNWLRATGTTTTVTGATTIGWTIPAGTVVGDVIVVQVNSTAATYSGGVAEPGWESYGDVYDNRLYWREAQTGDAGTVVTFDLGATTDGVAQGFVIAGGDLSGVSTTGQYCTPDPLAAGGTFVVNVDNEPANSVLVIAGRQSANAPPTSDDGMTLLVDGPLITGAVQEYGTIFAEYLPSADNGTRSFTSPTGNSYWGYAIAFPYSLTPPPPAPSTITPVAVAGASGWVSKTVPLATHAGDNRQAIVIASWQGEGHNQPDMGTAFGVLNLVGRRERGTGASPWDPGMAVYAGDIPTGTTDFVLPTSANDVGFGLIVLEGADLPAVTASFTTGYGTSKLIPAGSDVMRIGAVSTNANGTVTSPGTYTQIVAPGPTFSAVDAGYDLDGAAGTYSFPITNWTAVGISIPTGVSSWTVVRESVTPIQGSVVGSGLGIDVNSTDPNGITITAGGTIELDIVEQVTEGTPGTAFRQLRVALPAGYDTAAGYRASCQAFNMVDTPISAAVNAPQTIIGGEVDVIFTAQLTITGEGTTA